MGTVEVMRFSSDIALAESVAERWLDEVEHAFQASVPHLVALSGGRIARTLFTAVTRRAQSRPVRLDHVHFFWSDERCVPPTDPESNFALAWQNMLLPLLVEPRQIHRIKGEFTPSVAASDAEAEMTRLVENKREGMAQLDLIFLGVGEDGHVASLFPGASSHRDSTGLIYEAVISPKPPPERITMTYRAIAAARQVWVLASGPGKEEAVEASLRADGSTPLARVFQMREKTFFFNVGRVPS